MIFLIFTSDVISDQSNVSNSNESEIWKVTWSIYFKQFRFFSRMSLSFFFLFFWVSPIPKNIKSVLLLFFFFAEIWKHHIKSGFLRLSLTQVLSFFFVLHSIIFKHQNHVHKPMREKEKKPTSFLGRRRDYAFDGPAATRGSQNLRRSEKDEG